MDNELLKFATDFSGLGSPEEALKMLQVPHEIVFACDKDEYAKASYLANHKPKTFYNDITTRNHDEAAYSDIYAFGFPCQAFSLSGKRLGFEDTRGTLFFNSLSYIQSKKPRVFVAENVKGLLSHDKPKGSKAPYGRTFGVIRDALGLTVNGQQNLYKYDDCVGYHIFFQVLNTKNYGLPQNRERIFIVGFRDEQDAIGFKFPKPIPLKKRLKDVLEDEVDEKYYLSEKMLEYFQNREKNFNGGKINFKGSNVIASSITSSSRSLDISDNILVTNDNGELRSQTVVNCLDANYSKGPDNHGQRSFILETPPEVKSVGYINQDTQASQVYDSEGVSPSICAGTHGYANGYIEEESKDFALRGRENKDGTIEQNIEFRKDEVTNTITSVQKDNLILVSKEVRSEEGKSIRRKNLKKGIDYNPQRAKDIIFEEKDFVNTLQTSQTKDNLIVIPANTQKGFEEVEPYDSINISNPNSKTRRGRVGKSIDNTLETQSNQAVLIPMFGTQENNQSNRIYSDAGIAQTQSGTAGGGGAKTGLYLTGHRIRRLTPLETFRLQGYRDEFFYRCVYQGNGYPEWILGKYPEIGLPYVKPGKMMSDTQLYKQSGNSISVHTFMNLTYQILKALRIPCLDLNEIQ